MQAGKLSDVAQFVAHTIGASGLKYAIVIDNLDFASKKMGRKKH